MIHSLFPKGEMTMKKLTILAAVLVAVGYVFRDECRAMCPSLCCKKDKTKTSPDTDVAIPPDGNAPV